MKKILSIYMTLVVSLFLISCTTPSENDEDNDQTIKINGPSEVEVGKQITLNTVTNPEDLTVTWTSSDNTLATVDNGIVTGVKAGQVEIKASLGDVFDEVTIKINEKVVVETYQYDGVLTVAPYTAYNADGSVIDEYGYLFDAIRNAGLNGTSSNLAYVLDANGLEVFKRQAKNRYYMYDGMHFNGSANAIEALNWSNEKMKSYVVDGQGIGFVNLGIDLFENSPLPEHIELNAGAYNYLFSKEGQMQNGAWVQEGFGYLKTTVRLSEATYQTPNDGGTWNAYIFINHKGQFNNDLGLIGTIMNGELAWRPVRNSSHPDLQSQGIGFAVLSNVPVTTMKLNDQGFYDGADDITIEVFATKDAWKMIITNLETGYVYEYEEIHEGMHENSTGHFRMLLAASLVPVTGNVWNARNGSYLKNVIFEDVKIARYNGTYTYTEAEKEDFYPGSEHMLSGFSYAADAARHQYGVHQTDGFYKSGAAFYAGKPYISFSSFYDGSEDVIWSS